MGGNLELNVSFRRSSRSKWCERARYPAEEDVAQEPDERRADGCKHFLIPSHVCKLIDQRLVIGSTELSRRVQWQTVESFCHECFLFLDEKKIRVTIGGCRQQAKN